MNDKVYLLVRASPLEIDETIYQDEEEAKQRLDLLNKRSTYMSWLIVERELK